jgi:glycosyltransferase involved in cell wall biosynthesis
MGGTFIQEHVKALALRNEAVVFFLYMNQKTHTPSRKNLRYEDGLEDGTRTIRIQIPAIRKLWFPLYVLTALFFGRKVVKNFKPDIIHAHVTLPAGLVSALLSKFYKIPFIVSEHTGPFSLLMPTRFHKFLVRWTLNNAKAILPVSEHLREQIITHGIKNNFYIVPNPFDPKIFFVSPDTKRGKSQFKILFVGGLSPEKNIPLLLEALAILREREKKDFALDIVGDGKYRNDYENLARKLKLDDVVIFRGLKTKPEVSEFMRACDFLVLPSKAETFGCVLIEAMACGKPVLATKYGGPAEIVTESVGKLVYPKDPETLADAIRKFADELPRYSARSISEYALTRYGLESVGNKLHVIYQKVAET